MVTFCKSFLKIIYFIKDFESSCDTRTGFDVTTRGSYFMILVEAFTNHILAKNIFRKSYRKNRSQDYASTQYSPVV